MANPYAIPEEKILERIQFENPWWINHQIAPALDKMNRRLYFERFMPHVRNTRIKRAITLMGPRRVGKTVMMHHAIDALLKEGTPPSSIHLISIDNPIYINISLEQLLQLALKASGTASPDHHYFFFDEIQYLKDWERHLKVLVDSYPDTKFIVSGSAAAALRLKSTESGAGRFHEFMLPPLTFQEFLHLQDEGHLVRPATTIYKGATLDFYAAVDIKALNERFFEYLNYGGYPEVIFNEHIRNDMARYIKSDIIDKVLLRDLPSLYGIRDVQELNRFFAYLAYNTGREFSPRKLSRDSGLRHDEVKKYLEYLEAAFLIRVVYKVDENARHFKRVTAYKVFLTNPSLRTALFSPVGLADDEAGNLVETAIYAQWMHREHARLHYAKWKAGRTEGEVDMVMLEDGKLKPLWALEIKWSNRFARYPEKLKSLLHFCRTNGLAAALATSIDRQEKAEVDGIEINFYPASVYAYAVGANTLT